MTEQATSFRLWYNRWGPVIMGICLVIGATAAVLGVIGIYTNGQQDAAAAAANKVRDQQNAAVLASQQELLACFDRYASAQSTGSKEVREASQAKDDAAAELNAALSDEGDAFLQLTTLLGRSLAGDQIEPDRWTAVVHRLESTLQARQEANAAVIAAQAALDTARAENPVPDPPSEFCGSDADTQDPTDQEGATP